MGIITLDFTTNADVQIPNEILSKHTVDEITLYTSLLVDFKKHIDNTGLPGIKKAFEMKSVKDFSKYTLQEQIDYMTEHINNGLGLVD